MSSIAYGSKYRSGMDVKEIAAAVRSEIKAAVASGALPKGLKASVRIRRYSGGRSVDVELKCPGLKVYNVARLLADRDAPHDHSRFNWRSAEADKVVKAVEAMLAAYNFDGSDPMTDYYNVNFYSSVELDGDRDEELAALPPVGSPEARALAADLGVAVREPKPAAAGKVVDLDAWVMKKAVEKAAANGIRPLLDATVEGCAAAMWHEAGAPCALCAK